MSKPVSRSALIAFALVAAAAPAFAVETQRQYLSGKGSDDAVLWDFTATASGPAPLAGSSLMNIGKASKIKVPSNWELQGFGVYTYGSDNYARAAGATNGPKIFPKITGKYHTTFTTPQNWSGSRIFIVFAGSMTDTSVAINGKSAGPTHQGGYYQFKYDITDLIKPGDNALDVTVDDESANASINNAERRGDYWNYGGIFRPVYLEAVPQAYIDRIAIDARADGTLHVQIAGGGQNGVEERWPWLEAQVLDMDGKPVGEAFRVGTLANASGETKIQSPRLWTAETPNLYQLEVRLKSFQQNELIHTVRQKFGFRTIEVRAGEGLFVNGQRIMLKGADRHSFWPDTGRTLNEKISRDDINVMKDMNMNAVRMSHYPPDAHFLDACDEMGLYVLDELGGWHQSYDTPTGHRLVEEMLVRDVNHPSILFWDNGNEGGWNTALDDDFAKWDPQKRGVIHPQATFRGLDNSHYPQYNAVVTKSNGNLPFFPTEMLHGLYDGGAGAGLEDYWKVMSASKVASGGFIWALLDESVKRTDLNGKIDSHSNMAPDGILGPYREKEGSAYTIKRIWSPIVITKAEGAFTVENHYAFLDAKDCAYTYELWKYKSPTEPGAGHSVVATSKAQVASISPGKSGALTSNLPPNTAAAPCDATAITVRDPGGRELWTYVWPNDAVNNPRSLPDQKADISVIAADSNGRLTATAGDLVLTFDKSTGLLASATRGGKGFSLANGPRFVSQNAAAAAPARGAAAPPPAAAPLPSKLTAIDLKVNPATKDALVTATYEGAMKSIGYTLHANGWLTVNYAFSVTGEQDYFGVGFDYPEANVKSMRYLGSGPYRVWKNRLAGGTLDVWDKTYNNPVTGDPSQSASPFEYPEFKGYYAGVRWMTLSTTEGPITALLNQEDLFVQVFTPKFPKPSDQGQTGVNFPKTGIAFLHAIPAIGSKFTGARTTGPMGQPTAAQGEYSGSFSLYFGELPH